MAVNDRVLTVKEVAEYLKVHTSTVYRFAQSGKIPSFKIGGDWRFNKESVDRWRMDQERTSKVATRRSKNGLNVVKSVESDHSPRHDWAIIDLHGNRKLLVDVLTGEQKILSES